MYQNSFVRLQQIDAQNSVGVRFVILAVDNVVLRDLSFMNTSYSSFDFAYPNLYVSSANNLSISNIAAQNHYGPMLAINNALAATLYNCSLTNLTTSRNFSDQNKGFLNIIIDETISDNLSISFDDVFFRIEVFNVEVIRLNRLR